MREGRKGGTFLVSSNRPFPSRPIWVRDYFFLRGDPPRVSRLEIERNIRNGVRENLSRSWTSLEEMRARRDVRASIFLAESTTVLIQLKNVKEEAAGEFNFFFVPSRICSSRETGEDHYDRSEGERMNASRLDSRFVPSSFPRSVRAQDTA